MANTLQIYIAMLALTVNSFVILVMLFLGNIILAPIISQLEKLVTGPQALQVSDVGYLIPAIWAILIVMEIVCIISFFAVIARRETVEDYGGY
jgi:hypothetical protein